ncbi:MAG: hypothetical protein A2Z08_07480 [Deltaproteobacteria bacterium RBG_16_54_11]|nr:MAG: hypothetical protein A2Z08_07480 [Deltaproteobacteria bacterium RBG_16_54_11]
MAQGLLRKEEKMEVGDKITFLFGKGEKEGIVYKIFPKTVYIKVDFPKHKGKIIKRSIAAMHPEEAAKKKDSRKKEEEKKKKKAAKEERKREKAVKKSTE